MQHTLIPAAERAKLHREYYLRVAIVLVAVLAVAMMVGCAALFPAFISAWSQYNAAQNAVTTGKGAENDILNQDKAKLSGDASLLAILTKDATGSRYTDALKALITTKGDVIIDSFDLAQTDKNAFSVAVSGEAPTRDDLLSFKSRLETRFPGAAIDVPIDQLAKSVNLPFVLRFSIKIP